jgi:hypothetical protein
MIDIQVLPNCQGSDECCGSTLCGLHADTWEISFIAAYALGLHVTLLWAEHGARETLGEQLDFRAEARVWAKRLGHATAREQH